jgi:glucose-6-phosphate isomerase
MQFKYQNSTLLSTNSILQTAQSIISYVIHLNDVQAKNDYTDPECSINLPADQRIIKSVNETAEQLNENNKLKYIIDIGIGGSNLGTKAIYDALYGYFDTIEPDRLPKMIFLDTNDETYTAKLIKFLEKINDPEEIVINAISKSGGTTETISNLEIVFHTLQKKFPDIKNRLVLTTDENSRLWNMALEKGIKKLPLPSLVGGRYSVFSAVGLFPLKLAGVDIEQLLAGAENIKKTCLASNVLNNPALLSAAIIYLQSKQNKNIHDTFSFLPQLESIGKWYRQLMGESIGKEQDLQGNKIHAGITPTLSIGSTDLHSVGQLYLGGPKDKITTFLYTKNHNEIAEIPEELEFNLVPIIKGKRVSNIMNAILEGTKTAYTKQQLPFVEVEIDKVDEYSLGEFLQFKMIEMMYLGKLMNVNPFDQPHVELYKVETKRILEEN